MHVGIPPSGSTEDRPPSGADAPPRSVSEGASPAVPASGAALVPVLAIFCHVVALWWGPLRASALEHWLPWPLEALLVWLPWTSVCLWAASSTRKAPRSQRLRDAGMAAVAWFFSLHYVVTFRFPSARGDWSPERHLSELAGFLSTTWHGAPWTALLYGVGWSACAALIARVGSETSVALPLDPKLARQIAGLIALTVFLIGSSGLLRYATGSPWPLLGIP